MSLFSVGDPAPWFTLRSTSKPKHRLDTQAGRYVVLSFYGSAGKPEMKSMLQAFRESGDLFDDENITFFGVSNDPQDESEHRVEEKLPGYRFYWDLQGHLAQRYNVLPSRPGGDNTQQRPVTYVLDPNLRFCGVFPIDNPANHAAEVLTFLRNLPAIPDAGLAPAPAPILVVPRLFEPELCRELIDLYDNQGGMDSGVMQTGEDGKTFVKINHNFKSRRDYTIDDPELRKRLVRRIQRRLVPEIQKAFQFHATRIERYLVACYAAEEGGKFRPHRDNTTKTTLHRRFACSINLNSEEYEGGLLRFPEYGRQTYKPPTGGAVIFSCSMLHEATPVTKGLRYCFLPFLYDDPASVIKRENDKFRREAPPTGKSAVEQVSS